MSKIGTFFISTVVAVGALTATPGNFTENRLGTTNVNDTKVVSYYATPKLILTGRDIKGNAVKAGDTFDMVLHFKNESTSTKLRNISIKLSSEGNEIVTASGSDSIYIDYLVKEEEVDVTVQMKAREDLEQKNYSLQVAYKYEDNNKNSFEDAASVTVPVEQEARLGISEVKLSKSELAVDGKTSLSFKVNNMGLDKLRNVTAEFSGDTIQEISYYVGTVESGASGTVDMTITPDTVGTDDIHISISYEDATGNVKTFDDSVKLTVNDAEPEKTAEVETEQKSSAAVVGVGVAAVLLLVILVSVIKKRRQKRFE